MNSTLISGGGKKAHKNDGGRLNFSFMYRVQRL